MSISKRLHDERAFKGGWRAVVVSPSRVMDQGGTARWRCTDCRWFAEGQKDSKEFDVCPRCGGRLEQR